jgi:hypothetical protein|tara:strand:+ start:7896 stop:8171 length:276 start_codon:yes stop_codon:yes gene_type:complete
MKLKITRQNNTANEISIDMDMIINEQIYHLTGYINFQDDDAVIDIICLSSTWDEYRDLYDFCEEMGYDYYEIKNYIMNHTDNKIPNYKITY